MLTLALLAGAFVGFGAFVVLAYRKGWQWTGLPAAPAASTGAEDRPAKTLWDWLQLLGIPVVLTALAFVLTDAQSRRDERRVADAEQEKTLRTYLAQMSDLMLERQLLRSKRDADVRNVARTATLTAVRRLDGSRRGLVVQFLAEARLLRQGKNTSAKVVVALADLSEAKLSNVNLSNVDLSEVDLSNADLSWTLLREANLYRADLHGADLSGADIRAADVTDADLRGSNLSETNFFNADLLGSNFRGVDLRSAFLRRADFTLADLRGADLRGADLSGADFSRRMPVTVVRDGKFSDGFKFEVALLSGADLRRADLSGADLRKVVLRGKDLSGVDLNHALLNGTDLGRADLRGADLRGAHLRGANLREVDLSRVDLRRARGVDTTGSRGKPAYGP